MQGPYLSYRVYRNLEKMLRWRKLLLVSGDLTNIAKLKAASSEPLEEEVFTPNIQHEGYIMLAAKDSPEKDRRHPKGMHPATKKRGTRTVVVLLDRRSSLADSSSSFTRLIGKVPQIKSEEREENLDVLVVVHEMFGSNISNKFSDFESPGTENGGWTRITALEYKFFHMDMMRNYNVSPARILSREEEKELCEELFTVKLNLARMRVGSAVAVWLGAEVGDVIEELLPSEASGIETRYSLVRP